MTLPTFAYTVCIYSSLTILNVKHGARAILTVLYTQRVPFFLCSFFYTLAVTLGSCVTFCNVLWDVQVLLELVYHIPWSLDSLISVFVFFCVFKQSSKCHCALTLRSPGAISLLRNRRALRLDRYRLRLLGLCDRLQSISGSVLSFAAHLLSFRKRTGIVSASWRLLLLLLLVQVPLAIRGRVVSSSGMSQATGTKRAGSVSDLD